MTQERELRDTLSRLVGEVQPSRDAWEKIQGRMAAQRGGRGRPLLALAAAIALAVASFSFLVSTWQRFRRPVVPRAEGTVRARVGAMVPLPGVAESVAVGDGAVWASIPSTEPGAPDLLLRIDPTGAAIVAEIPVAGPVGGLVAGEEGVWGIEARFDEEEPSGLTLVRIDPGTGDVQAVAEDIGGPIAVGHGSVWGVRDPLGDAIVRIDAATMARLAVIPVPGRPSAIVTTREEVWALVEGTSGTEDVLEIDVAANRVVRTIDANALYAQMAAAGDRVWISSPGPVQPSFVDSRAGEIRQVPVRLSRFHPFAAGPEGVWFVGEEGVCYLDAVSGRVAPCIDVSLSGLFPPSAAADPASGSLWIANAEPTLTRVDAS